MKMKILAFTGMPFSGKTEAVKLAKNRGIPIIRMGDMIWREVENQGLELSDKNVGLVASKMREKFGKNIWAKKTLEEIRSMGEIEFIVIDGIRNIEEIDLFKNSLGKDFILIAIQAPEEIRYKRALTRNRRDDSKDLTMIKDRDKRELNWGLGEVIASADIVVSNENSIDSFKKNINNILKVL